MGRVVKQREPLWLPEDRAWALALAEVEADQCPGCSRPWSEVSDPAAEDTYQAEVMRCHACSASARHVNAYQQSGGTTEGLHVNITKRG